MNRIILLCLLLVMLGWLKNNTYAQLQIDQSKTPEQLVRENLVGEGIAVSNIKFKGLSTQFGPSIGAFDASGISGFSFPIADGVILTTGPVEVARGLNEHDSDNRGMVVDETFGLHTRDIDLQKVLDEHFSLNVQNYTNGDVTTYDVTVLEFDLVPSGSQLRIDYVFASEEYPENTCFRGNSDVMGIFLTGKNPNGQDYNSTNIAKMFTFDNDPDNDIPVMVSTLMNQEAINISGGIDCIDNNNQLKKNWDPNDFFSVDVQYDGFSTLALFNIADVIPGEVYHIKIAVGDALGGVNLTSILGFESILNNKLQEAINNNLSEIAIPAGELRGYIYKLDPGVCEGIEFTSENSDLIISIVNSNSEIGCGCVFETEVQRDVIFSVTRDSEFRLGEDGRVIVDYASGDVPLSQELCVRIEDNPLRTDRDAAVFLKASGLSAPPSETDCASDCISSYAPEPGKKYVLSAWVSEEIVDDKLTFRNPVIDLIFEAAAEPILSFSASGPIIDGWQKIEQEFILPDDAAAMNIKLRNNSQVSEVFFDDIRIFPFDANMKSFVYDPFSLRLVAELDENNYSTYYEYDEEGRLVRVKKETERGVMTIQENRSSTRKAQ